MKANFSLSFSCNGIVKKQSFRSITIRGQPFGNRDGRGIPDLRANNKVIQPMGPLKSGIPLPSLLPKGWPLIVIDLKDCFFTIPLQEKDREKFAFTVPTYNLSACKEVPVDRPPKGNVKLSHPLPIFCKPTIENYTQTIS